MPFFSSVEAIYGYGRQPQTISNIQSNNLVLWYDSANTSSYPGLGATWSNLVSSNSGYTYSLANSLTTSNLGSTNGFSFNGLNQYTVNSTNIQTFLTSGTSNETREIWFYWRGGNSVLMAELGSTTPNSGWHDAQIILSNSSLIFTVWQGGPIPYVVYNSLASNTWYHIAFQFANSSNLLMAYVNGVRTYSNASIVRIYNGASYFLALGADDSTTVGGISDYYNGLVSIYRWYNTIVSSNDIYNNFQSERGRFGV
jgi:hypothetical protein